MQLHRVFLRRLPGTSRGELEEIDSEVVLGRHLEESARLVIDSAHLIGRAALLHQPLDQLPVPLSGQVTFLVREADALSAVHKGFYQVITAIPHEHTRIVDDHTLVYARDGGRRSSDVDYAS